MLSIKPHIFRWLLWANSFNRSCLEMICWEVIETPGLNRAAPAPLLRSAVPCAAAWCRRASRPTKATAEATKPHPNCSKFSLWCGVLLVDCQNVAGGSYPAKDWISAGCFLLPAIITKDERIKFYIYIYPSKFYREKRSTKITQNNSTQQIPPKRILSTIWPGVCQSSLQHEMRRSKW